MRDLVALTATGREQARLVAAQLRGLSVGRLITSPVTRAMETAHIIAEVLGLPLTVEFDLHEWLPDLSLNYDSRQFAPPFHLQPSRCFMSWTGKKTRLQNTQALSLPSG